MWLWIRMCFALVKRGYQKYHHNILPWPPMPNSICFEFHFFFLFRVCVAQPPSDTDWDSLAVFSHFNFSTFSALFCFLSAAFGQSSERASVLIWHLSTSLPLLSSTQPAVSGCSDGDEESGWGQRHLTMPPSVPVVQLTWHWVATAETKLQTESGEIRFLFLPLSSPFHCNMVCQGLNWKESLGKCKFAVSWQWRGLS